MSRRAEGSFTQNLDPLEASRSNWAARVPSLAPPLRKGGRLVALMRARPWPGLGSVPSRRLRRQSGWLRRNLIRNSATSGSLSQARAPMRGRERLKARGSTAVEIRQGGKKEGTRYDAAGVAAARGHVRANDRQCGQGDPRLDQAFRGSQALRCRQRLTGRPPVEHLDPILPTDIPGGLRVLNLDAHV